MFEVSATTGSQQQRRRGGSLRRAAAWAIVVSAVLAGPAGAAHQGSSGQAAGASRPAVSEADVQFMAGMIPHHAQAVLIAGWAPGHGARPDLKILCERIVVAQRDEIAMMQGWLRDRGQKVPDATNTKMHMSMNGMEHDMLMPGMLTDEQLAELDKARGETFDRLFLNAMIRHHQGAITMVEQLFASYGAAQDDVIFRFASDVVADQSTEIERMQKMLATVGGQAPQ